MLSRSRVPPVASSTTGQAGTPDGVEPSREGVGAISVVTEIGAKGATYPSDGPVRHDNATTWWIVHPN